GGWRSEPGDRKVPPLPWRGAHEPCARELEISPPHCIDGSPGAERVFAELPSLPRREIAVEAAADPQAQIRPATHYVVKKKVFDLFSNRWLEGLRRSGAFKGESCAVFGVATDYCVRACALGLAEAGAHVLLIEDAVRGVSGDTTSRTIDEMRAAGVEFTTTDEVLMKLI